MKPVLDIRPVTIPAHAVHAIEGRKGLQITALSGTIWVTQPGDQRDIILTRGRSFILDRGGRTVVYAFKDAAILVGPAGQVDGADFSRAPASTRSA
ncbi:MAG: DUF2917 domain-containing protein [Hyphomicrobiaceae bacterium]|nr:DUF2917 domain-containing protein [Hyphomicrobiaceae bacterium]